MTPTALAAEEGYHFVIDDLAPGTADDVKGDGKCATRATSTSTATCTLRAALEEANALANGETTGPVLISISPDIRTGTIMMPDSADSRMYENTLDGFDDNGAFFWIDAPDVTIDFGNRVGIEPVADGPHVALFYVSAPNATIQNFTNLVGAETSIVVAASAPGLEVLNGRFDYEFWAERVLVVLDDSSDITLRDIFIGKLYNDAAIHLANNATVTGLTLDQVEMDRDGSRYSYPGIGGSGQLNSLTVTNSTFAHFNGDRVLDFAGVTLNGALIEGNRFVSNTLGEHNGLIHVGEEPTGKVSIIRGNQFDNSEGGSAHHAIRIVNNLDDEDINPLVISDNYFVGFTGPAVFLREAGILMVERNRFGHPSYGATNSDSESSGNTFVYNSEESNDEILTWYPTNSQVILDTCDLDLMVAEPTDDEPAPPVALDVYFSTTGVAEIYVGRWRDISRSPTTIRVPNLGPGSFRVQTLDDEGRSSQYSRALAVQGTDQCRPTVTPHWGLTLAADPPPDKAVRAGGEITYTATASYVSGDAAGVDLVIDLSDALDDTVWVAGSLTVAIGDLPPISPGQEPAAGGQLVLSSVRIAEDEDVVVRFGLVVRPVPSPDGDKDLTARIAAADGSPQPDACPDGSGAQGDAQGGDPDGGTGGSAEVGACRVASHLIAALKVVKTGRVAVDDEVGTPGPSESPAMDDEVGTPAPSGSPATVTRGDEVAWAYTVTNIGSAPLQDIDVIDDQGVDVTCPDTSLAPGGHTVCSGSGGVGGAAAR